MRLNYSKQKVVLVEPDTLIKSESGMIHVLKKGGLEIGDTYFATEQHWEQLSEQLEMVLLF